MAACSSQFSAAAARERSLTRKKPPWVVRRHHALVLLLFLLLTGSASAGRPRRRDNTPSGDSGGPGDPGPEVPPGNPAPPDTSSASALHALPPGRRRGSGAGTVQPAPPMEAAPADFVAGSHAVGVPMVLPAAPAPPAPDSRETLADAAQREGLRDLFAFELALGQFQGDCSRLLLGVQQACSACGGRKVARTGAGGDAALAFEANAAVAALLTQAGELLRGLRHSLSRSRAGRNLPPVLAFEEASLEQPVDRGPVPALMPHPDVVIPRCLRYHTPVLDALIWRFVNHVEPTGCSQQAHLLRNYPPYLVTHAEPLAPAAILPTLGLALSALSLQPAVAAGPVVPPVMTTGPVSCDAALEPGAADGGGPVGSTPFHEGCARTPSPFSSDADGDDEDGMTRRCYDSGDEDPGL